MTRLGMVIPTRLELLAAGLAGAAALVVALDPAAATRARTWMSEAEMRTDFVGQTLDGHYGSGTTWTETYFNDNRIDYRESNRAAKGRWHFRGDVFCTFYDPPYVPQFVGGCWQVLKTSANCYEFYTAGTQLPRRSERDAERQDDQDEDDLLTRPLRWNARGWRTSEPSSCPEKPSV